MVSYGKKLFIPLYKTMVKTQLDYASSVWAPYKKKHIDMIENVQKRATKQIPGMNNLPYEERLRKLELPTLSYRRLRGDMIEVVVNVHSLKHIVNLLCLIYIF